MLPPRSFHQTCSSQCSRCSHVFLWCVVCCWQPQRGRPAQVFLSLWLRGPSPRWYGTCTMPWTCWVQCHTSWCGVGKWPRLMMLVSLTASSLLSQWNPVFREHLLWSQPRPNVVNVLVSHMTGFWFNDFNALPVICAKEGRRPHECWITWGLWFGIVSIGNYAVEDHTLVRIDYIYMHSRPVMFVYVHRYTLFIALYPIGVTGELLCLYAAQAYVAQKKLWSLEMPNALNLTFSYHYFLLFIMFLYIPCKFQCSRVLWISLMKTLTILSTTLVTMIHIGYCSYWISEVAVMLLSPHKFASLPCCCYCRT